MTEAMALDDNVATHPGGVWKHMLPPLPYDHAALEPYIDASSMKLHHGKHHASYVEKLNAALHPFPETPAESHSCGGRAHADELAELLQDVPSGLS